MEEPPPWKGMRPGGRLQRRQAQGSTMHLPQLHPRSGTRQLTPPHDLMVAFARRWLRQPVLTAKPGHRAQGQDVRANNRADLIGLRLEALSPASMCGLWLVTHHLGSSSQAPSCCPIASLPLPTPPQRTMDEGRRGSPFFPKGQPLPPHLFQGLCSRLLVPNDAVVSRHGELAGRGVSDKYCHS